jgi:hypothetical protein
MLLHQVTSGRSEYSGRVLRDSSVSRSTSSGLGDVRLDERGTAGLRSPADRSNLTLSSLQRTGKLLREYTANTGLMDHLRSSCGVDLTVPLPGRQHGFVEVEPQLV